MNATRTGLTLVNVCVVDKNVMFSNNNDIHASFLFHALLPVLFSPVDFFACYLVFFLIPQKEMQSPLLRAFVLYLFS